MTTAHRPAAYRPGQVVLGLLLGLAGHGLAFGAGFLAAQLVEPSPGGGFEDVAAVALTFLGVELLVALAVVVAGVAMLVKGRRDLGVGLLLGWLLGAVVGYAYIWLQGR